MKRTDFQTIGEVLRQTIEENRLDARLAEVKASELWPSIVGKPIAALTGRPTVKAGVMYVSLASAPLRHDMMMHRSYIISRINDTLGRNVISDIRFIS